MDEVRGIRQAARVSRAIGREEFENDVTSLLRSCL